LLGGRRHLQLHLTKKLRHLRATQASKQRQQCAATSMQASPSRGNQPQFSCKVTESDGEQEQDPAMDTAVGVGASKQPSGKEEGKPPKGPSATHTANHTKSAPQQRRVPCARGKKRPSSSKGPRGFWKTAGALKAVATLTRLSVAATHVAALQDAVLCKVRLDMWARTQGRSAVSCDTCKGPQTSLTHGSPSDTRLAGQSLPTMSVRARGLHALERATAARRSSCLATR
jgi:hypothetical protein